jgi:hypothetical protein
MKVDQIKQFVERQPFRPFAVRLTNGVQYTVNEPRNFGAPRDYRVLFFFGDSDWVLIDTDNIAELIAR